MPLLTNKELDRLHGQVAYYLAKWVSDHRLWCHDVFCEQLPHKSDEEILAAMKSGATNAD